MKQVLFMAMLAAGMLLTGCSKSESSEEQRKGNDMEQSLTKEQIVGVWRSGDYWVSFSEDGFMSAYLSDKCITEGDYTIDGDTVKADNSEIYFVTTFLMRYVSPANMESTITYYDFGENDGEVITKNFSFTKSSEEPCTKNNILLGKSFSYDTTVTYYDFSTNRHCTVDGFAECKVRNYCIIDRILGTTDRAVSGLWIYYIYLPPFLYFHAYETGYNKPLSIIEIKKLLIDDSGNITVGGV